MKKMVALLGLMLTTSTVFAGPADPVITFVCKENPNKNWYGGIEKVITFSNGTQASVQITSLDSYRIRRESLPGQTTCESVAESLNKQLLQVNGDLNMNGLNVIK